MDECTYNIADVVKMGKWDTRDIVSRAGIEPKSISFCDCVLTITPPTLMLPLYPRLPVYAAPCLRGQCTLLHSSNGNCRTLMLTITYIQAVTIHIRYTG